MTVIVGDDGIPSPRECYRVPSPRLRSQWGRRKRAFRVDAGHRADIKALALERRQGLTDELNNYEACVAPVNPRAQTRRLNSDCNWCDAVLARRHPVLG